MQLLPCGEVAAKTQANAVASRCWSAGLFVRCPNGDWIGSNLHRGAARWFSSCARREVCDFVARSVTLSRNFRAELSCGFSHPGVTLFIKKRDPSTVTSHTFCSLMSEVFFVVDCKLGIEVDSFVLFRPLEIAALCIASEGFCNWLMACRYRVSSAACS